MQTTEMFWWIEHHLFTIFFFVIIFFLGGMALHSYRGMKQRQWIKHLRKK
jgi:hypothetical protein